MDREIAQIQAHPHLTRSLFFHSLSVFFISFYIYFVNCEPEYLQLMVTKPWSFVLVLLLCNFFFFKTWNKDSSRKFMQDHILHSLTILLVTSILQFLRKCFLSLTHKRNCILLLFLRVLNIGMHSLNNTSSTYLNDGCEITKSNQWKWPGEYLLVKGLWVLFRCITWELCSCF